MIAVVTGTVGVEKKRYLRKVMDIATERGTSVKVCNVGDMMYAEAPEIAAGKILDISRERLHQLRRSVMKDVIARSRQASNMIVNTHAAFRWRHGLFPAFDFDQMRMLNADIYVCLIDSVDNLHVRLMREHRTDHTLKDLLVWREEEIFGTEVMARGSSPDNIKPDIYLLARAENAETAETFYRLMFESGRKKAYLSFPMTHVMNRPDVMVQIEKFRDRMKATFISFDPGDLDEFELPVRAEQAIRKGNQKVELDVLGEQVILDAVGLRLIEPDIHRQIYARDFALIDQSDMIISFIPPMPDGRPAISSGVERELQHAYENAKDVYVIWTAESTPSVFITQTASKVFRTVEEAEKYFAETFCPSTT